MNRTKASAAVAVSTGRDPLGTAGTAARSGAVPVLYVAGNGRSGSTLLGRVLARLPGVVCVGELVFIWSNGLRDNQLCGCGEPFLDCPFWARVGEEAFGGWSTIDAGEVLRLRRAVDRNRYLPLLAQPALSRTFRGRLDRYTDLLGRLYDGIQQASGAAVVLDTSKHPSYAFLLRQVDRVDLRVIHLVRSSHGVCHSWTRQVRKPEITHLDAYMQTYRPARTALEWSLYNAVLELLPTLGVPTSTVCYEDFIRAPRPHVERILGLLERQPEPQELQFLENDLIDLPMSHSLSGNPMRFRTGPVSLRVDEEWRQAMPRSTRAVVTALTFPGLARYGYLPPHRTGPAVPGQRPQ